MTDNSLDLQKKNYHHGDLRGALIEAVRQLIERDGADKFKIAEACRIAGVSTAAPYKHFKDRTDILQRVALSAMGRLYQAMIEAAGSYPAGDIRRIVAMGEAYTGFARAEPGVFPHAGHLATDSHRNPPGSVISLPVRGRCGGF